MSDSPRVSVVVTCYNLGRYLDEAVDSVLAQSFQDFEILVVDDGSTEEETRRLLADYRRPRTRVIHIENRGLPGARNAGIRQTTGPYVCALDADDRLERTYFEKAVAVLDRDPSVAFVSHWLRTFGDGDGPDWTPTSADFPELLDRNTINGAALVRRDALLTTGLFDETMRHGCEDWDLWIGMVERGLRGVILPEVLFFYRRRPDSMSRIMMEGETHVGLYRYLIEKHPTSFERHLVDLLVRRESDRANVLREAHDLELDYESALRPEIERLRGGLRVSTSRLERVQRQREQEAELERRAHEVTERDGRLEDQGRRLAEQGVELDRLGHAVLDRDGRLEDQGRRLAEQDAVLDRLGHAVLDRDGRLEDQGRRLAEQDAQLRQDREVIAGLRSEIRALHSSLSWRLTGPLRALYAWFLERG